MMDIGQEFFQQIGGADLYTGSVDAGMAAHVLVFFHNGLIDQQADAAVFVIHQPKDADGAGCDIQKLLHIFGIGEGKAGAADLFGQYGGFEFFGAGHHEQVKIGFLGIAQEQILADLDAEQFIYVMAVLDGRRRVMVEPLIGDAKLIQQIIGADLLGQTAGGVGRATGV